MTRKLAAPLALLGACLVTPAALAQQSLTYPTAIDRDGLATWLRRETDITPEQVIAVSPSAITSVVSTYPLFSPPGQRVSVRAEAITPDHAARRGAVSWQTTADLDCAGRRIRVGATTGYTTRNLLGQPIAVSPGDNDWRTPPAGTQLESIWRAFCDKSFQRPLAAGVVTRTTDAIAAPVAPAAPAPQAPPPAPARVAATPAPAPARPSAPPPAPAPRLAQRAATPAPAPAPRGQAPSPSPSRPAVIANVAVQVVGSPDEAEARRVANRVAARRPGLSAQAVRATVNGRVVYRGLVRGFASRAAAGAFCEQLKAAGQACFLR